MGPWVHGSMGLLDGKMMDRPHNHVFLDMNYSGSYGYDGFSGFDGFDGYDGPDCDHPCWGHIMGIISSIMLTYLALQQTKQ